METNNNILDNFGKRVRALRIEKGLSQEDLAELSNLDRTYISSLERGHRNVALKNLAAISSALGISISTLLKGIDDD